MASSRGHSDFFQRVYAVARLIPFGRVSSYGAIARFLGAARSARMVGYAMNASRPEDEVPAHRVVNRKGLLTGKAHFDGSNLMEELLKAEGVKVVDNTVMPLADYFWDPAAHLNPDQY